MNRFLRLIADRLDQRLMPVSKAIYAYARHKIYVFFSVNITENRALSRLKRNGQASIIIYHNASHTFLLAVFRLFNHRADAAVAEHFD